ncbi:spore coat protein CotJB [Paenactinomyces guangxiensis]|uniref:Spore coat protein CotJB n=1 Tax=Paenactinomyces guangxiensis TaxID=1490290 RepID=A0A7W1WNF1_9BACL|nr:spore coat protein CotJB [Paenactinomyces guangxiensis]MBA4492929.1 spore coat protein CotJB [Paenactinomyces guangxiensis]MBH8590222.1 spore coat protein CotJB [Paenactinomyces guangxiensis]
MDRVHQLQLLKQLQEVDFVLVELNLYLDTHPDDLQALQQFNWYVQQSKEIRKTYESQYGPLLGFGYSFNQYPNGWDEGPWPWEV